MRSFAFVRLEPSTSGAWWRPGTSVYPFLVCALLAACGNASKNDGAVGGDDVIGAADVATADTDVDVSGPTDALGSDASSAEVLIDVVADVPDSSPDVADAGIDAPDAATACTCGDHLCDLSCQESLQTCPIDCAQCNDGICSPGEGPKTCAQDCCGSCGDGKCVGYECGENPTKCPQDCLWPCGNGTCEKGENPGNCAADCKKQVCGNGVCEPEDGGPTVCPGDCGNACGDCVCDKGESFNTCPVDCGFCGDSVCSNCAGQGESSSTCPADCKGDGCKGGCDDANPCTIDLCGSAANCVHVPDVVKPCDDGEPCTSGDQCSGGICKGSGSCADVVDASSGDGGASSDASAPTDAGAVQDGSDSKFGTPCATGAECPTGVCTATSGGKKCSAFCPPACPTGFYCHPALVTGGNAACWSVDLCTKDVDCDDGNPCTADTCDLNLTCVHEASWPKLGGDPVIIPCDDGNGCTSYDVCVGDVCQGSPCPVDQFCEATSTDAAPACQPAKCALPALPASVQKITSVTLTSKANSCDIDGDGLPDNAGAPIISSLLSSAPPLMWATTTSPGWNTAGQTFQITFVPKLATAAQSSTGEVCMNPPCPQPPPTAQLAWSQFDITKPGTNGICDWKSPPWTLAATVTDSALQATATPASKLTLTGTVTDVTAWKTTTLGRMCGAWSKAELQTLIGSAASSLVPDIDTNNDGTADAVSFSFDFASVDAIGQPPGKGCIQNPDCDDGDQCTADTCVSKMCEHAQTEANPCDDGNGCTLWDVCKAGKCAGTPCPQDQFCGAATVGVAPTCQAAKCALPTLPASVQALTKVKLSSKAQSCDIDGDGTPDNAGSPLLDALLGSIWGAMLWAPPGTPGWNVNGEAFPITFAARVPKPPCAECTPGASCADCGCTTCPPPPPTVQLGAWEFDLSKPGTNGICDWKMPPMTLSATATGGVLAASAVSASDLSISGTVTDANAWKATGQGRLCGAWPIAKLQVLMGPAASLLVPDIDTNKDGTKDAVSFSYDFEAVDAASLAPDKLCVVDADCSDGLACTTDKCFSGVCYAWQASCSSNSVCSEPTGECMCGSGYFDYGGSCLVNPACPAATGCACGLGYLAIAVDATPVCAPDFPIWGIGPISPIGYKDNGDGTVTHALTGLMWQQAADATNYTWADARNHCDALVLAGKGDWRLPTRAELLSIVDFTKTNPAIDAGAFPGTAGAPFWSAMPIGSNAAWVVAFNDGISTVQGMDTNSLVRCIR